MKYAIAAVAVVAAIAGGAFAQTVPAPAPVVQAAPSSCPEYTALAPLPDVETFKRRKKVDMPKVNEQTAAVNAQLNAFKAVHACRIAERRAVEATYAARTAEAKAGQDSAAAYQASWKAILASLGLEVTEEEQK